MMENLMPWIQWVQDLSWTTALRESAWGYPGVETSHVVSIVLFAGFVVMMDLRLVGLAFRQTPFSYVQARLFPMQMVGMALSTITGLLLLVIDPLRFYNNIFFWIKVVMLIVAGVNAMAFHLTTYRSVAAWDAEVRTPFPARVAGVASLALWAGIIVSGRLIAYNWFN
jgi:hypothetical protein